jgi:DNA-directed RNA polymerase subunit RPC12/RpoP
MNLTSTSWSCARCGAAFIGAPPEHGLCEQCLADLDALARLATVAEQPCPMCGGPVCADCGKALLTLLPASRVPPGLAKPAREVSGDDG